MDCPICKSNSHVKDGIIRGKQRFRCKKCRYHYTVERKSDVKTPETRRLALEMYLEGVSFRCIGRILNISYGTAYQWVKEWRSQVTLPRSQTPVDIVALEDMYTYVVSKKTTSGYGLLLIDLEKNISILSVDSRDMKSIKQNKKNLL